MARMLITKIETDRTTIVSVTTPQSRLTHITRIFAIVETCDDEKATGTLEVNLTPDEQELFNELTKRIASRITLDVTK